MLGAQGRGTRVSVLETDIFRVEADAMVLPTLSMSGTWMMGGLTRMLMLQGGGAYFEALETAPNKNHLSTVVARKEEEHSGAFEDVIFVIDDLEGSIRDVVKAVLKTANAAGYSSISVPMIRTGVQLGSYNPEPTLEVTLERTVEGLLDFLRETPSPSLQEINFVAFYRTPEVYNRFVEALTAAVAR